jgi:Mrp family chromosome partitioning ATPase
MRNIKQALERASGDFTGTPAEPVEYGAEKLPRAQPFTPGSGIKDQVPRPRATAIQQIELRSAHLESNRIIAHDDADVRSKSFDMLRTQVLQAMDQKNWKLLGITSPSPGCGKTVTSINLAFSIARHLDRQVLLVDFDLQRPKVATTMGITGVSGLLSLLEDQISLSEAIVQTYIGRCSIKVLPVEKSISDSSTWMASRAMNVLLRAIRTEYQSHIIIFDLPPILASDDVITVLPQLDCALLVAAAGTTKATEIEECNRHLKATQVIRFVLNKAVAEHPYYYRAY